MAVRRVEVGRVEKDDSVLVVQVVVRRREILCKEVFFPFLCTRWYQKSVVLCEAEGLEVRE